MQPANYLDKSLFYNWKRLGSLTPLPRGQVLPKLSKMGIQDGYPRWASKMGISMTILNKISSTQLTEVMCLVCVILYDTKVQKTGMPDYVPDPYRNRAMSSDMAMEKIRLISSAVYFNILRNRGQTRREPHLLRDPCPEGNR